MRVGEVFVTKGKVQKSMRIMGRGRAGIQRRKWSHLNLTLREIDFDALIEAAESRNRSEKLKARKKEVCVCPFRFVWVQCVCVFIERKITA